MKASSISASPPIDRVILLAPDLAGKDGVSAVSRQALAALREASAARPLRPMRVEAWSLNEGPSASAGCEASNGYSCCAARGDQRRFALWGLKSGLRSARGAMVVAMHLHLAPVALPLALRGARLGVFIHGVEAWRPLSALRARALARAEILMANSQHTIDRFKEFNPRFAARRVETCHLGAPPETEFPSAPESESKDFALIVGRMIAEERYKGHDLLLDMWPEIARDYPGARLVVVGEGDDRPRLERKAAGLGLAERVRFMGRVSDETLAGLYRDCGFFVMPSDGEGFGLVFLEAMRAGKACIAGRGAASEVVEHGATGLIVDSANPSEIRGAISRLFRERETRERMGLAGEARLREGFTSERFRQRFLRILGLERETAPCAA